MQIFSQVEPTIGISPYLINAELTDNAAKLNFTEFSTLNERKSYIPISSCVLDHIIITKDLSNLEKLYYLLVNSLSFINYQNNKQRSTSLASKTWAKLVKCSKSQVFLLQKSLEEKGYLIITKDRNIYDQNKRNLLTPTLPNTVFNTLCKSPNRARSQHLDCDAPSESKLEYLDRIKLFIPFNYNVLKIITSSEDLSPLQKIIWLDFYVKGYKYHISSSNKTSSFSFITSYRELMEHYGCSKATLSKTMNMLENNNFITKNRFFCKKDHAIEDRQDKSLWQITLSLSASYNLELTNIKDRSSIYTESNTSKKFDDSASSPLSFTENSQKLSLTKKQLYSDINALKENSEYCCNNKTDEDYVLEEFTTNNSSDDINIDSLINTDSSIVANKNYVNQTFKLSELKNSISCTDPHVSKSSLYINKDLKIKDIKSNLGLTSKVLFNKFLNRFKKDACDNDVNNWKKEKEFNIHSELIREKLKILPKDKADKARKFAYSLVSKSLANGYAASLSKHELAKQIIHHAATWKPTKLGFVSREKEIDTALSVAWKAIVAGTWKTPLELAKAEILQYEFRYYKQKYRESGIISNELSSLESATNKLLKTGFIDLKGKIINEAGFDISCHNAVITKTEANEDRNFNALLDHSKNIELPSYLEDREYYLSYGYRDHSYMNNDDNRNESLISRTEYKDTNITGNDENGQNNSIKQILDLSTISEKQRYLRMNCSEKNNEMIVKTLNDTEYFFKLKTMEVNEEGDTVMTLKHVKLKTFIEEAHNEFLNDGSNVEFKGLKDNYLTKNTFSIQNQEPFQITDTQVNSIGMVEKRGEQEQPVQISQSLNTGFMGQEASKINIDTALSNILKNIQREVE